MNNHAHVLKFENKSTEAIVKRFINSRSIEDYLTGQVKLDLLANENEESLIMSEKIIQYGISNLDELWGAEVTLSYPNSYAGTADASGIYEGKQSILDFKQSNKPKKISHLMWLVFYVRL